MAKVRTGGMNISAFPSAADLLRFIYACHRQGIAFKATAGLHHAWSGRYPLTPGSDGPHADMYGFLNVCIAAALVVVGAPSEETAEALAASSGVEATFSDVEDVYIDLAREYLGSAITALYIEADQRRRDLRPDPEDCLALLWGRQRYVEEDRRYDFRKDRLFTFYEAVLRER